MKKLTGADYLAMPWKNGGGETIQLAVEPPGTGLNDFDWRISTARVENAGPFSLFAGVDRSIAILRGEGMAFDVDGRHVTILTPENKPFAFRGEQQVHALLLDGPVSDFNVMTRRTRWSHVLQTLRFCGSLQWSLNASVTYIYCAHGEQVRCRDAAGNDIDFAAGESLRIESDDGDHVTLSAASEASLYVVSLVSLNAKGNTDVQ